MNKPLIVANWKMNPTTWREARELLSATRKVVEKNKDVSVVIAPPTIFLRELRAKYKGRSMAFGVQDISHELFGAHTGETSVMQAKEAGATWAIIGHSEARARGETNEATGKKVAAALNAKMTPILCVGEITREHSGEYLSYVRDQLRAGFADVLPSKLNKIVVAYEPVWAIGKEEGMNPRSMHEMAIFIRKTILGFYGDAAMSLKILYGGGVTEVNVLPMLSEGDVSGLLVGHVSIDPERFSTLLRVISRKP